jgi:hypothetical protein
MAATILSGTVTPTGNYTLYTNNTGQNVRLIIHHLFVHGAGAATVNSYSTRRVNITGGSHGTLKLPSNQIFETQSSQYVVRIKLGIGKGIAIEDQDLPTGDEVSPRQNIIQNGCVRVIQVDNPNTPQRESGAANGPQIFPTEIVMRPNQSMQFEASSSTSQQFISFNITVMPEGG